MELELTAKWGGVHQWGLRNGAQARKCLLDNSLTADCGSKIAELRRPEQHLFGQERQLG